MLGSQQVLNHFLQDLSCPGCFRFQELVSPLLWCYTVPSVTKGLGDLGRKRNLPHICCLTVWPNAKGNFGEIGQDTLLYVIAKITEGYQPEELFEHFLFLTKML